ncbi:MAG: iron-sulfur cluster repair di-iron protein [Cyclobacteriaceae bacterium]
MLLSTKISEIVQQNFTYGYVLYYMGIKFFEYKECTLAEVCASKGMDPKRVIADLEASVMPSSESSIDFQKYPVELIIQYLSHKHQEFTGRQLPYLSTLIDKLPNHSQLNHIAEDLKFVFPLFVEDFINHIYEEEEKFFGYIRMLIDADRGIAHPSKLYYAIEEHSLEAFAEQHHGVDNEMDGIRSLTNNYVLSCENNLHFKATFEALRAFEEELLIHAKIENEILFPKAISLENKVRRNYMKIIRMN